MIYLRAGHLVPIALFAAALSSAFGQLPAEPIKIKAHEPHFVFDRHVIDSHWPMKLRAGKVIRRYHQPVKYEGNPLSTEIGGGFVNVIRSPDGKFRAWYQGHSSSLTTGPKTDIKRQYAVAYAVSENGLNWVRPTVRPLPPGFFLDGDNYVILGDKPTIKVSSPFLIQDIPEEARRGYEYLMLVSVGGAGKEMDGIRLVGSMDGINWDMAHSQKIKHIHSDTQNSVTYDHHRGEYVLICRPKHIYRTFQGNVLDTGESRRVARMSSKELWTEWIGEPQTIMVPDELDSARGFNAFYGMPTRYYGGVYWGFLWPFQFNDPIYVDLAFSRDSWDFHRDLARQPLLELGEAGAWDDGMIFATPNWVEVGDEWWIYYGGSDGGHRSRDRKGALGLAKIRKEGFISMHSPGAGGVLVTRALKWNGGDLLLNVDASQGEVAVRVVNEDRSKLPGFDYKDMEPGSMSGIRHRVAWKGRLLSELKDHVIRFEFFIRDADLFTFVAGDPQ